LLTLNTKSPSIMDNSFIFRYQTIRINTMAVNRRPCFSQHYFSLLFHKIVRAFREGDVLPSLDQAFNTLAPRPWTNRRSHFHPCCSIQGLNLGGRWFIPVFSLSPSLRVRTFRQSLVLSSLRSTILTCISVLPPRHYCP